MRTSLLWILPGLLFGLTACEPTPPPAAGSGGGMAYPLLTVAPGSTGLTREFSAALRGRNDVDIYPQVSGTLTEIAVADGQVVSQGQLLFVVDPTPYEAVCRRAEANVDSAQAGLATAKLNYDSKNALYEKKAISAFEYKSSYNDYLAAQAILKQARAEFAQAQIDLERTRIASPVDGVLGMISLRRGALVSPNLGRPLVTVSDNRELFADFSLSEKEMLVLTQLKTDQDNADLPLRLRLADGTVYEHAGRLVSVSGLVDQQTGAVTLRARYPNPDGHLRSGGAGAVIIPVDLHDQLVIPQTATFELQDKIFVYKVIDGRARAAAIEVLPMNDGRTYVVTAGLTAGDVIIADGAGLVTEGVEVRAK